MVVKFPSQSALAELIDKLQGNDRADWYELKLYMVTKAFQPLRSLDQTRATFASYGIREGVLLTLQTHPAHPTSPSSLRSLHYPGTSSSVTLAAPVVHVWSKITIAPAKVAEDFGSSSTVDQCERGTPLYGCTNIESRIDNGCLDRDIL